MHVIRHLVQIHTVAMCACLLLAGCDGGVSYNGETQAEQEAQPEPQQEVGGSKSTLGKARDRAEDVVGQIEQQQQEMLDKMNEDQN